MPRFARRLVSCRRAACGSAQAAYFRYFLRDNAFSDADLAHYAEAYVARAQLRAIFEFYRAFPENPRFDAAQRNKMDAPRRSNWRPTAIALHMANRAVDSEASPLSSRRYKEMRSATIAPFSATFDLRRHHSRPSLSAPAPPRGLHARAVRVGREGSAFSSATRRCACQRRGRS
jgi:hypothetical protein